MNTHPETTVITAKQLPATCRRYLRAVAKLQALGERIRAETAAAVQRIGDRRRAQVEAASMALSQHEEALTAYMAEHKLHFPHGHLEPVGSYRLGWKHNPPAVECAESEEASVKALQAIIKRGNKVTNPTSPVFLRSECAQEMLQEKVTLDKRAIKRIAEKRTNHDQHVMAKAGLTVTRELRLVVEEAEG